MKEAMQIIDRLYRQGKLTMQERNTLVEAYKDSKAKAKTKKEAKKTDD